MVVSKLDAHQNPWGTLKSTDDWALSTEILMRYIWSGT